MKSWFFPSRSRLTALLASCVALALTVPAQAATVVDLPAGIDDGMAYRFLDYLQRLNQEADLDDVRVRVSGPGGYAGETLAIARAIHELGLDTEAVGECSSACAIIWLAGKNRYVDRMEGALVGFHGSRDRKTGQQIVETESKIVEFYAEIGMSLDFVMWAIEPRGGEVSYLTPELATQFGITIASDTDVVTEYLGCFEANETLCANGYLYKPDGPPTLTIQK